MRDKRIDKIIDDAPDYAVPVVTHLRALVHKTIPEIEETIKWNMPTFEMDGKIVAALAIYKKHIAFRFWKGAEMQDPEGILLKVGKTDMRHIGNVGSLKDLPNDEILEKYLQDAAEQYL